MVRQLSLLILTALAASAHAVTPLPHAFTVEGRLYDGSGAPLNDSAVSVRLEVVTGTDETCVLYREEYSGANAINVSDPTGNASAAGHFALALGHGALLYPGTRPAFTDLFSPGVFTGQNASDGATCTVTAGAGVTRLVRVGIKTTGPLYEYLSPNTLVTAVPTALVAESALSIQGYGTGAFIMQNASSGFNLSQANVENIFSSTNYSKLTDLLAGRLPASTFIDAGNQRVTNVASPGTTTDAVNKGYADSNIGGKTLDLTTVPDGGTLVWNQTQNKWVAQTLSATGAAGGDLTGSFPNPSIATGAVATGKIADGAVTTVKIASDAITSAKVNSTGVAANRLIATDATTGTTLRYFTCNPNEIMKWTATGWACDTVAALAPVKTVAGRTPDANGNVAVNASDLGLGTAALRDIGTGPNQVVIANSAAQIAQLDGSQSAPSYAFANSTSTGMYREVGGQLAFSVAGTKRMLLDGGGVSVNAVYSPSLYGGSGPGDSLNLFASSDANKGNLYVSAGKIGINNGSPRAVLDLSTSSDALLLPFGDDGNRPTSPVNGMLRYHSNNGPEVYLGASWKTIATGTFLPISGGTLTGALRIADTTPSTGTTSGSLVTNGGAGIRGNLFVGGNMNSAGNLSANGNITAATITGKTLFADMNDSGEGLYVINRSSTADQFPGVTVENYAGSNAGMPRITLINNRGTNGSVQNLNTGDSLGTVQFLGQTSNAYMLVTGAAISSTTDGTVSAGNLPANLTFATSSGSGPLERMRIKGDGTVGIATTTPRTALDVAGTIATGLQAEGSVSCSNATPLALRSNTVQISGNTIATGACAINLSGLIEGATYTIAVTSAAATNAVTWQWASTGLTFKYNPVNGPTTPAKDTIFSMIRVGTIVYVSWVPGFN